MREGGRVCPVCKSGIPEGTIVPVFAGDSAMDEAAASSGAPVPPRPRAPTSGQNSPGSSSPAAASWAAAAAAAAAMAGTGQDELNSPALGSRSITTFGMFPALFGIHVRMDRSSVNHRQQRVEAEEHALFVMSAVIALFVGYILFL